MQYHAKRSGKHNMLVRGIEPRTNNGRQTTGVRTQLRAPVMYHGRTHDASFSIFGAVVFVCSPACILRIRVNFCVFDIFLPFIAYSIFPQVCFVHNFCNLTDTANLRQLKSIMLHPPPNNGNFENDTSNVLTPRLHSWRRILLGRKQPWY
jgi:hypothetical protein